MACDSADEAQLMLTRAEWGGEEARVAVVSEAMHAGTRQGRLSRDQRARACMLLQGLAALGLLCLWAPWRSVSRLYQPAAPAASGTATIEEIGLICSKNGQNCTLSKCCAVPGHRCYAKNSAWAACRPSCSPGPDPMDPDPSPWSCAPLGPKAAGAAPPPDYSIKEASWVATRCSGSGENCTASRCCKEAGHTCYRKITGWSACKPECTPGPDPTDADHHPWECKPMGMRTPGPASGLGIAADWVATQCSAQHENCLHTRCCKDKGYQCYLKQGGWAMCMPSCIRGPLLTDLNPDIWNCTALGGRTPGIPKMESQQPIAPWVKTKCSKAGENCTSTMCCAESTMQCYNKNKVWSSCLRGCAPGIHKHDKYGGAWSCASFGVRTPRPWGKPTLYCYSVIRLGSYEAPILRQQVSTDGGIGIFGCDMSDVLASDGEGWIGDGPSGPVWTHRFKPAPVGISIDGTAGNTQLFINVWTAVKHSGKYALTDWTVKVDPDAVLIADKLRQHLLPHTGIKAYIKNCNSPTLIQQGPMMFGSVEAISKTGLIEYYASSAIKCHGNFQWGEDRWMGDCLSKIGVKGIGDWKMEGDKLCVGVGVGPDCTDQRAAYHPFKSLAKWMKCYNEAKAP